MNKSQKDELTLILDSKIPKLEKEIAELDELIQPISPDDSIGRISRMDAIVNQSVMEASLRAKKKKLSQLKEGRRNINKEDFGKCEFCGSDIRFERLKIMPESSRCMQCVQR